MTGSLPALSVVIPIFNEEDVIERTLDELFSHFDNNSTVRSLEVICVDDGSRDGTPALLEALAERWTGLVICSLSRNFGKEAAILAGLRRAQGDAVVIMDADLQHPPACVPRMVELWREGYEVVNGVKREGVNESFLHRGLSALFSVLMAADGGLRLRGSSDFKLLDRVVVDALLRLPEQNRFFRGLVAWAGCRSTQIEFDVPRRVAGKSKWSSVALVGYAVRNLVSFSTLPLKLTAGTGVVAFLLGASLVPWTLYRYFRGDALTGFTTVILLQLLIGGLMLTALGVIALYLGELFREVKGRPAYLLRGSARTPAPSGSDMEETEPAIVAEASTSSRDGQQQVAER